MNLFSKLASASSLILVSGLLFAATGCRTASPANGSAEEKPAPSGAELWANNCARCHNFRSPASYGDAEWDVAVHHMRVRANLTAEEHRLIVDFLKSAN